MHDQVCLATNAGSDKPKKVPTEFTPSHQPKVKLSRMIKLSRENFAIEVNRSIAQATTEMNGISTSTNNMNILQLSASKKKKNNNNNNNIAFFPKQVGVG